MNNIIKFLENNGASLSSDIANAVSEMTREKPASIRRKISREFLNPNSPIARNRYIYGLAKEIYVAQTNSSGGTWNGAIDGLKKKRNVYVYYPEHNEESASFELLKQGAKAVNFNGQFIDVQLPYKETQLKMF